MMESKIIHNRTPYDLARVNGKRKRYKKLTRSPYDLARVGGKRKRTWKNS